MGKKCKVFGIKSVANRCLEELAVSYGERYNNIEILYRSQHASVVYGKGGQEDFEFSRYQSKHNYRPTKWHNAGAEWEVSGDGELVLRLENHRGKVAARVSLYSVVDSTVRLRYPDCPAVSDRVSACVLIDWLMDRGQQADSDVVRRWCGLAKGRASKALRQCANNLIRCPQQSQPQDINAGKTPG